MNATQGVEEFQGLYGPYQVSELVLQKIWQKIAFDSARMKDSRGRQIEVLNPGRWNRLAGPDFKDAIFRIDGDRVEGDVEINFSQSDWKAHGHDKTPILIGLCSMWFTIRLGGVRNRCLRFLEDRCLRCL